MLINSVHLGIKSTFNATGDPVGSIWVVNPFRNLLAVFTPTGLGVTAVGFILFCLITKKGYIWFSGYKFIRDKRGFDILPDGTHGTSGFMSKKEQEKILLTGPISELSGTLLGKLKDDPDDDDKYAEYVTLRPNSGLTEHIMVYGATGAGKTRGLVKPFILQCAAKRSTQESLICVDPKGEVYHPGCRPRGRCGHWLTPNGAGRPEALFRYHQRRAEHWREADLPRSGCGPQAVPGGVWRQGYEPKPEGPHLHRYT